MTITITKLYNLLSEKLGRDTAENLTEYIEAKIEKELNLQSVNLATKSDISDLQSGLKAEIAKAKFDMVKWGVSLFVVTVLLIVGLYFK
jgi:predicted DNA-binding protein